MKPITILKKLITAYYYLIAIGVFIRIFTFGSNIYNQKQIAPTLLKGDELYSLGSVKVAIAEVLMLILTVIFFYAIKLLRDSLDHLSEGNHFSSNVIKNFKNTGILFIICGFGELLGKLTSSLLLENNITIDFDSSMILLPVIGLFFIYLSEVFTNAKAIQSENELTV